MYEEQAGIRIEVPGSESLTLTRLLLDISGTLSSDGVLLPGVFQRLEAPGEKLRITVLTADTFASAVKKIEGHPVDLHFVQTGQDKADFLAGLNRS
jgi:soluble P-type ATPase